MSDTSVPCRKTVSIIVQEDCQVSQRLAPVLSCSGVLRGLYNRIGLVPRSFKRVKLLRI